MAFSTVILAGGTATAINVVHAVQSSDDLNDVWTPAIAGGMVVLTLAFVDNGAPPLASMLAILFLMATLLLRGKTFFDSAAKFVTPTDKRK